MKADADIVILGAGCAGLSLAASLGAEEVSGSVMLLEPRRSYTRDRTWCFWNTEDHLFTSAISYRWASWRVSREDQAVVQQSSRYQYCHIAGDDFYYQALRAVEENSKQELCRGVSVHSVEQQPGGLVRVETSRGGLLAREVFDSRPALPPAAPLASPLLLQRFVGWHVRAAWPCFDERTVELMRFLPSDQPGRVRFLYLLPFSPTEALVEMTYLDAPELPEPSAEGELKQWLEENVGEWEVVYAERGALPMAPPGREPRASDRLAGHAVSHVHAIGARGGRLKPSSGYGFIRIQRHSRAIARAIASGRPVPRTAEPQRYRLMDAVFLRALQTSAAAELFLAMFAGAQPDALVRFLGEASPVSEALRVAWSLPKLPMLGAAIRSWRAL